MIHFGSYTKLDFYVMACKLLCYQRSIGECNTILSTCTLYRHLDWYRSLPLRYALNLTLARVWLNCIVNLLSHNCNFKPIPPQWHLLTSLGNKPFENTVGKGEIARNEQFLLFPQCFLLIWRAFYHFNKTWNCRLQTLSVWKSKICRLVMG